MLALLLACVGARAAITEFGPEPASAYRDYVRRPEYQQVTWPNAEYVLGGPGANRCPLRALGYSIDSKPVEDVEECRGAASNYLMLWFASRHNYHASPKGCWANNEVLSYWNDHEKGAINYYTARSSARPVCKVRVAPNPFPTRVTWSSGPTIWRDLLPWVPPRKAKSLPSNSRPPERREGGT